MRSHLRFDAQAQLERLAQAASTCRTHPVKLTFLSPKLTFLSLAAGREGVIDRWVAVELECLAGCDATKEVRTAATAAATAT